MLLLLLGSKDTPDLRPSPYSKRWFTPELKGQQKEVNYLRRKWQESCVELGPQDTRPMSFFRGMRQKRWAWTRAIECAKISHWKQFLDEAGEGKLWKAATYMKPRESWGCIPSLVVSPNELTSNEDKAEAVMEAFPRRWRKRRSNLHPQLHRRSHCITSQNRKCIDR